MKDEQEKRQGHTCVCVCVCDRERVLAGVAILSATDRRFICLAPVRAASVSLTNQGFLWQYVRYWLFGLTRN